jgi:hypothetical protein
LDQVFQEANAALDTEETAWLALAISPLSPGQMEIRQQTIADARTNWIGPWAAAGQFGSSVFHSGGFNVSAGVAKVVIAAGREHGSKSKWGHAELYQDGAGFVAVPLWKLGPPDLANREVIQIDDEQLINASVSGVRFMKLVEAWSKRDEGDGQHHEEPAILEAVCLANNRQPSP